MMPIESRRRSNNERSAAMFTRALAIKKGNEYLKVNGCVERCK